MLSALAAVPILHVLNISTDLEFKLILASSFVAGMGNGVLSALIFSLAISISSTASQAVMLFFMKKVLLSSFIYFVTCGLLSFACIVSYIVMIKSEQFKKYKNSKKDEEPLLDSLTKEQNTSFLSCINAIKRDGFLVFFTFTITLALFPGLTAKIGRNSGPFVDDVTGWYIVVMSNLFMVGDFIGRSLPSKLPLKNIIFYIIFSISRVVFVMLFAMCFPPFSIFSDWLSPLLIMLAFSFTNGYASTTSMVLGSESVAKNNCDPNKAGTLLTVCLNLGLFCGSNSSSFLVKFLKIN
ncbi:hypothetical protein GEMRC1_001622 [Eukaryota sp. GEM-RC1]